MAVKPATAASTAAAASYIWCNGIVAKVETVKRSGWDEQMERKIGMVQMKWFVLLTEKVYDKNPHVFIYHIISCIIIVSYQC